MEILVISNNPERASFRQRIAVHLSDIHSQGISTQVMKLPSGPLARLALFRQAADYDAVILHKKTLNCLNAICLRKFSTRIIYDFDDAVMYNATNPDRSSMKRQKAFQRTVSLADQVIAGNPYLAGHASKFNDNVEVLATGLDVKAYEVNAGGRKGGRIRLVWIGSKSTLRYLAEIRPALEEIGSRFDNVVLRIICDQFFDLQNMPVEQHAWSIKTQVSDLISSDIGLAPQPDNRFTRGKCGFKILQYYAAGLPVIAAPVGVNSEYVKDRVSGYHATSIPQWIDGLTALIRDAGCRRQMGDAGRVQVETFDLELIGRQLCGLLERCISRGHSPKNKGSQSR